MLPSGMVHRADLRPCAGCGVTLFGIYQHATIRGMPDRVCCPECAPPKPLYDEARGERVAYRRVGSIDTTTGRVELYADVAPPPQPQSRQEVRC